MLGAYIFTIVLYSSWMIPLSLCTVLPCLLILYIYLAMPGLICSMQDPQLWHANSCGMQDLVSWSGIKPRPPALAVQSLSYWTTRYYFSLSLVTVDIYIYIYYSSDCGGSSLPHVGFHYLCWVRAALCHCTQASTCGGFLCCGAEALSAQAPAVSAHRLSSWGSWAPERRFNSCMCEHRSVVCGFLWSHGLYSPWDSPGQNTALGCHFLLQRIFPILGLNPDFLHCRQILYQLGHQGCLQ